MKPTMACGHTEYDHGHCAWPGCDNDYRLCRECNPAAFRVPKPRRETWEEYLRRQEEGEVW